MSLVKRHNLRGLNLRQTAIVRSPEYASDVQNVEYDSRKQIVKRFGYDLDAVIGSPPLDLFEYKKGNELLGFFSDGMKRWNGTSFEDIPFSGDQPTWTVAPSVAEYNGVVYWSDPSQDNFMFKYDGFTQYRAGVPKPDVTVAGAAGFTYYRVYIRHLDLQGNVTSGDYVQFDSLGANPEFDLKQMGDGFYEKYAQVNGAQTLSAGNPTINVQLGHNYSVGDWLIMFKPAQAGSFKIQVSATGPTSVTFDVSNIGSDTSDLIDAGPLEFRSEFVIFSSANETFGYEKVQAIDVYGLNINATPSLIIPFGTSPEVVMEDVYDTTILKGLPPKFKYIDIYNNIMVGASLPEIEPELSTLLSVSQVEEESSVAWSDLGVGSTIETFPPFNVEQVGKSNEGSLTGIFAASDNVVLLKEKQVYYLNGNLTLRSFRIRSALTNGIGCVSHRSIQEIEGGCIFMSSRGLYHAMYGQKPTELSDIIEPIFREFGFNFDLSNSKTVNDIENEKLLIFIPALTGSTAVLVYDYLFKEWFIHMNIEATSGLVFFGSVLYHSDGINLYKRSLAYNDNNVAISAYYKTGWEDFQAPTVTKKFDKFVMISLGILNWTVGIRTQVDWDPSVNITDETFSIDADTRVESQSLNMTQKKSMRFEVYNNVKNEGMTITGMEYEAMATQERPKGDH